MRITYTNTPDDYIAATRYQLQHPPFRSYRWIMLTLRIFCLLFAFVPAVWMTWQNGWNWLASVTLVLAAIYSYEIIFQDRIFLAIVKWQSRKWYAKPCHPKYAELFRERDLELGDGRIIDHSPKGFFVVNLKYVRPLMSTTDLTIVVGPTRNYIIPRRAGHEAEYDRFVEALQIEWNRAHGISEGSAALDMPTAMGNVSL